MIQLTDMHKGDSARIVGFNLSDKAYRHKLMAMGLTRGAVIRLVRVAPLGDPIEIHVRGFDLSLRKAEAASLNLELCE